MDPVAELSIRPWKDIEPAISNSQTVLNIN